MILDIISPILITSPTTLKLPDTSGEVSSGRITQFLLTFYLTAIMTILCCQAILHVNSKRYFQFLFTKFSPGYSLRTHPPNNINSPEVELARTRRTKLAKLRAGYYTLLNSYTLKIDPTIAAHRFNCQCLSRSGDCQIFSIQCHWQKLS